MPRGDEGTRCGLVHRCVMRCVRNELTGDRRRAEAMIWKVCRPYARNNRARLPPFSQFETMWWPRKFALLAVGGIALVLGLLVTTMCVSLGESPHCGVRSGFRGDRHRLEAALEGHGVTALASYPRSGNSLTRLLLERVTGVWTGSVYLVHSYKRDRTEC